MDPKKRKLMVKIVGILGVIAILLSVLLPALSVITIRYAQSQQASEVAAEQDQVSLPLQEVDSIEDEIARLKAEQEEKAPETAE